MDIKYLEEIIVFLINLSACWLALWVYCANKKDMLNQWFTVMTFFVAMWVDFAFLANRTKDVLLSTLFYRVNFTFVALFLMAFYFFYVIHFLNASKRYIIVGKIVYFAGVILAALSFFTEAIVKESIIRDWGSDIVFGWGNLLFNIYAVGISLLVVISSIKKYIHLQKNQKLKVQYFSIGIFFFLFCNLIFNIIFPITVNTVQFSRFGDYSAIILLVFTAYAITKNNLMGVKALLAQVIIIVMSIILAVDIIFFSNNIGIQVVKVGILFTFLYFSRELIRNVQMEQKAKEKIEKANMNLAERNQDLNILLKASEMVNQNLNSRKISQDIVDSIPDSLKHLGYSFGIIVLFSSRKDCVYVYAVTDSAAMRNAAKQTKLNIAKLHERLSLNNDLIARTINDKKIYVGSRMEDFLEGFIGKEKSMKVQKFLEIKSFVSVPLFSSGQVMGAIIFANKRRADCITERSKNILYAFSSHIGPSIENARLYEKTNLQMKELAKLNRNLKIANNRLNELLEMKNDFLHITSHQLRTPLTSIRGMISMWIEGDFDKMSEKRRKEMLQRIYASTERLNNITNDMLDALELEGGVIRLEFKKVSVVEIIKDTITTLKSDYDKKGLYLKLNSKQNIPEIEAEPNYIAQVFMNLIDNACKYTKAGGAEIDIGYSGKYVNITIKDTGIGMSKDEIGRAFEKFTRGKNAMQENASGSGLGLFIVKKLIDEHNGKIRVESEGEGKGTIFKVSLLINQEKR